MTIKEIIIRQHYSNTVYLLQQGLFYHAYNEGAEFINSHTGYKVRELYLPHGEKYKQLGFPISSLDKVIRLTQKNCPKVIFSIKGSLVTINV